MVQVGVLQSVVLVGVYLVGDWITVLRHGSHVSFV